MTYTVIRCDYINNGNYNMGLMWETLATIYGDFEMVYSCLLFGLLHYIDNIVQQCSVAIQCY